MEVLHTSYIVKSKINFIDADLEDTKKRNTYAQKTPTTTLPFLETKNGNISESISIEIFLAKKHKPEILGSNAFEHAKINQWIEFANCEIQNCAKELIYPIFKGKKPENKGNENEDKKFKKYLSLLEKEFKKGNKFIMGNKLTLADIVLFRYLRFFFMFYLTEKIRNSLCPKLTQWFENIMNTKEAIDAYGRTVLCKKQLKPLEIKQEKKVNKILDKKSNNNISENKEIKKEKNILDLLPPSKFDLKNFKKNFFENKNKNEVMTNFWKQYDPKGYSLYFIEYENLPSESTKLFRMKNSKNFFLERFDENFKYYSFGIHGVYNANNEYKIRGVWLCRGENIPNEIKENDYFKYLKIRKLKSDNDTDKKLVEEFWTKCNKGDLVDEKKVEECTYFY
jgi:elongation factor 1-gamma